MADKYQACPVCGGSGGWKLPNMGWYETNYADCPNCEGKAFIPVVDSKEDEAELLKYNQYRKRIMDAIEKNADLISCFTENNGRHFDIRFVPHSLSEFSRTAKLLLLFDNKNSLVNIEIHQAFFYNTLEDKLDYHIKLTVECKTSLEDIEGFIEILESGPLLPPIGMYKKSKGKLK